MFKIDLNKNEYDYLCKAACFADYRNVLFSICEQNGRYLLNVSEDEAEQMRDLCGEQLQIMGFDEEYALTPEGIILEDLVDKFFTG